MSNASDNIEAKQGTCRNPAIIIIVPINTRMIKLKSAYFTKHARKVKDDNGHRSHK